MTEKHIKILADSNFFIALANQSDSTFSRSRELFDQLCGLEHLVITKFVTVVSQRISKQDAIMLGNELIESVELITIDEEIFQEAWHILVKDTRKNLSFTYATSLSILKRTNIKKFLTFYKKEFKKYESKLGFKIVC